VADAEFDVRVILLDIVDQKTVPGLELSVMAAVLFCAFLQEKRCLVLSCA